MNFITDICIFMFLCVVGAAQIVYHTLESDVPVVHVNLGELLTYLILIVVPALTIWYEMTTRNPLEDDYDL
jgi:hypothetical protein